MRIRQSSEENAFSEPFSIDRGAIQGDIFSPPCFTIGLDSIFRKHDVHREGVGGPPLNIPPIPKLEYADDVAIPNKKTAESSTRLSALSTGGSNDACLDMSMKKTKCMPVRKYDVTETTEAEVIALNLKFKCPECKRAFPTEKGLKIHRGRWCDPDGPVRSRQGSLADHAVQLAKLLNNHVSASTATKLTMYFYLTIWAVGCAATEMNRRMLATGWRSRRNASAACLIFGMTIESRVLSKLNCMLPQSALHSRMGVIHGH